MIDDKKYETFRNKYPDFYYRKYEVEETKEEIKITYFFEVPNLTSYNPTLTISKKNLNKNIDKDFLNYLIFHVGLVELISYWKATCSPNVYIEAGFIDEEQIDWFKKLYFYGLGEFFFVNKIDTNINDFMNIKVNSKRQEYNVKYEGIGNLIPIGGGKDSVVTLELLKDYKDINNPFIINPKDVTIKCAEIGGYSNDKIISIKRTICKNLLELNKQGFLNGHTPFSAAVAFISYLTAYITGKKYIVLSNEASANESTVVGTKINHQYSKTYEFENDFNNYTKKYFHIDIKYFSMLRPISEFQIGMLFSNYTKYHKIFRSCNVGSKQNPWIWCNSCAKCLFVYIILSPYLYKDGLINIFGEDLFEKKELLPIFKELTGNAETKPFECVGTIREVRYSIVKVIKKLNDKLPYLLQFYKDNYSLDIDNLDLESEFNNEHNLPNEFLEILKGELENARKNN